MTGATTADVAVIGGGAIGLGIAWRAGSAGLAVTVVDPAPGRGASWAAAGMLAPVTEVHYGEEALLALTLASNERYPSFVAELETASGQPTGYRACGTLVVARDPDENAALAELFAFQQRLGLEVQRLRSRECRALEPALAPGVRGGILVEGDHQVDNRALVEALLVACARGGVTLRRERAAGVAAQDGRVTGVRLAGGDVLAARQVVVAAGAHSGELEGLPPEAMPGLRPVKGQLLHLRTRAGEPPLASHNIRGLDVYIVSRADGRTVVGATVEEQGFDTQVTAGGVYTLLRDAYELLPGITELALVEPIAGLRPATPDNAPLLGPAGVDGLVVATGHYRNGVLLTPITADGIAAYLTTGTLPELLTPFTPARFAAVGR